MASLGKKLLSAFIEVKHDKKPPQPNIQPRKPKSSYASPVNNKFRDHFEKLFVEANIPGPDYYEFTKMIEVMRGVPDEEVRYITAFAGLTVQGLDKEKLLSTADQYIQLLKTDAANFHNTVDAALREKVHEKKTVINEKADRIQQLTQEINQLQQELQQLQQEVQENEEKIEANSGGYAAESEALQQRIGADIEKIKRYIQ